MGINYIKDGQITVEKLIDELKKYPPDALVWHEGCDCTGAASTVTYDESDNSIIINRCN